MNRRHLLIAPVSFILALVAGAASVPSRPAYSEEVPGKPLMDKILFINGYGQMRTRCITSSVLTRFCFAAT